MGNLEIYFDPIQHKYTDNFSNAYTSVTTVIGSFKEKFSDKEVDIAKACEKIGRNPKHPKYLKYKNKTYTMILNEWKSEGDRARDIGNTKHDYLETSVKSATGFSSCFKPESGRLFTVKDIINNNSLGLLNVNYFIETGISVKYPEIFNIILGFVNGGWSIYAEICTYNYDLLISGLIDILLFKDGMFVVLDWKTNKVRLRFEAGYYDKDVNGNPTEYIVTGEKLKGVLKHLDASKGNEYTLQLSTYATLTERFGLQCMGLILCHIRHDLYTKKHIKALENPELVGLNAIDIHMIEYKKVDADNMINSFAVNKAKEQSSLLIR